MNRFVITLTVIVFALSFGVGANPAEEKGSDPPSGEITYKAPKEWVKEMPTGAMRKAQFKWPGVEGSGGGTMAVFSGIGGTVDKNLARWYSQFKSADGTPVKDSSEKKQLKVKNLPVTIAYLTGTYLEPKGPAMMAGPTEERPGYAMLGAIAETAEGLWCFKATGPQATISHYRESFEKFVTTFSVKTR